MGIRNSADYRAIAWIAAASTVVVAEYAKPELVFYLWPLGCYLATAIGTIAHNHNHRPTFSSKRANNLFGHVLTIFYGYPTLMWIPTHNLNHHHFVNGPGDATITWRYTNKHNAFVAATYFFVSSYFQSEPIQRYIENAKIRNRHLYSRIIYQYVFWLAFYLSMLGLALVLYVSRNMAFYLWFLSLVLPAIASISTIMFFNYIQHVHTDSASEHDHSRNFTGRLFNFMFFNNGYHTAHHEHPGMHWSELPVAHARLAPAISPQLCEANLPWFLFRQYLLAWRFPSFGTKQLGPEPGGDTAFKVAGAAREAELMGDDLPEANAAETVAPEEAAAPDLASV